MNNLQEKITLLEENIFYGYKMLSQEEDNSQEEILKQIEALEKELEILYTKLHSTNRRSN